MATNNPITSAAYRPGDVVRLDLKKEEGPDYWTASLTCPGGASDGGTFQAVFAVRGGSPKEVTEQVFKWVEPLTDDPK